jgi:hypothetical protein
MRWLRKLLGIQTNEERLLSALGIDPAYRERHWKADGITFRRTSISEVEGKIRYPTSLFPDDEFSILISAADTTTQAHLNLIRMIRENFATLLQTSVASIIEISGFADHNEFRRMAHDPSIMLGADGEEFDGVSWSLVVEWGKGDHGFHCEFKNLEHIETWGGD